MPPAVSRFAIRQPAVPAPTFEQRWSAWGSAYGGSNRTSGDPAVIGSHDLSARTAGFAGGLDYRVTPNTVVGVALAGGGTNWSLAQGLGGGKSDAFQAGVYGVTRSGPAYLAAAFAFTNHWMSTDRFAFAGDHLTASFNAQSFGARVESGYRFATIFGGLTPYAAIQAQNFRTGPAVGTPEQIVETLQGLEKLGMTYAITNFREAAYDTSGMELFESAVIPELRGS